MILASEIRCPQRRSVSIILGPSPVSSACQTQWHPELIFNAVHLSILDIWWRGTAVDGAAKTVGENYLIAARTDTAAFDQPPNRSPDRSGLDIDDLVARFMYVSR